ncbi:antitoxin VbhA family protein [Amnibacterium flavum]|uniref:Uncharacterized protein n=1 Tax=Amnibacterium flavum TaxID=2173173 RepID=A0A2V1HQ69_9MICO|nr:antitoxin VbhA family protein [Amnibacterium flavum]PVZ93269.1 hypothetical protein DDQ50_16350 [Amnibacterium flavum]
MLFDPEARWPDLFTPLSGDDRRSIVQALTAGWHEGWDPTRDDVANLVAKATGQIDQTEYLRRITESASPAQQS